MTNKEAIEQFKERLAITDYRKQIPEYYEAIEMAIAALERCNVVEQYRWERDIALEQLKEIGCGFGQNMDDVKKALEKADKYRWHDLRKNSDDLPEAIGGGDESEYVLVLIGTPEWNSWEQAYYHHDKKLWSTYEQNVFAWRYIEPFKEEADEE